MHLLSESIFDNGMFYWLLSNIYLHIIIIIIMTNHLLVISHIYNSHDQNNNSICPFSDHCFLLQQLNHYKPPVTWTTTTNDKVSELNIKTLFLSEYLFFNLTNRSLVRQCVFCLVYEASWYCSTFFLHFLKMWTFLLLPLKYVFYKCSRSMRILDTVQHVKPVV